MQGPAGMPSFPDPGDLLFNRYTWMFIGIVTIIYSIKHYMKGGFYSSGHRLNDKTVIITGGNSGIGKEMALDFARRGAKLILACRDETLGKRAVEEVSDEAHHKDVTFMKLDLNSFASVRDFAQRFLKKFDRLDILMNNAGVMMCPEALTEDGHDVHLQTNFFGPMLLTELLLERIEQCSPSRIVNTTSRTHGIGTINFSDLNLEADYNQGNAFAQSKLAFMMYCVDLADRLKGTGVTVNSFHPGVARTHIHRYMAFRTNVLIRATFFPVCFVFMKNAFDGAQTGLLLAVDPSVETETGCYYMDCEKKPLDEKVVDDDLVMPLMKKARAVLELPELDRYDEKVWKKKKEALMDGDGDQGETDKDK